MRTLTPSDLQRLVSQFILDAQAKFAGGLTREEWVSLRNELVAIAVSGLEGIALAGPAKRQWVLDSVGLLVDSIGAALLPAPLQFLWPIVGPFVRARAVAAASAAIETALTAIRLQGANA